MLTSQQIAAAFACVAALGLLYEVQMIPGASPIAFLQRLGSRTMAGSAVTQPPSTSDGVLRTPSPSGDSNVDSPQRGVATPPLSPPAPPTPPDPLPSKPLNGEVLSEPLVTYRDLDAIAESLRARVAKAPPGAVYVALPPAVIPNVGPASAHSQWAGDGAQTTGDPTLLDPSYGAGDHEIKNCARAETMPEGNATANLATRPVTTGYDSRLLLSVGGQTVDTFDASAYVAARFSSPAFRDTALPSGDFADEYTALEADWFGRPLYGPNRTTPAEALIPDGVWSACGRRNASSGPASLVPARDLLNSSLLRSRTTSVAWVYAGVMYADGRGRRHWQRHREHVTVHLQPDLYVSTWDCLQGPMPKTARLAEGMWMRCARFRHMVRLAHDIYGPDGLVRVSVAKHQDPRVQRTHIMHAISLLAQLRSRGVLAALRHEREVEENAPLLRSLVQRRPELLRQFPHLTSTLTDTASAPPLNMKPPLWSPYRYKYFFVTRPDVHFSLPFAITHLGDTRVPIMRAMDADVSKRGVAPSSPAAWCPGTNATTPNGPATGGPPPKWYAHSLRIGSCASLSQSRWITNPSLPVSTTSVFVHTAITKNRHGPKKRPLRLWMVSDYVVAGARPAVLAAIAGQQGLLNDFPRGFFKTIHSTPEMGQFIALTQACVGFSAMNFGMRQALPSDVFDYDPHTGYLLPADPRNLTAAAAAMPPTFSLHFADIGARAATRAAMGANATTAYGCDQYSTNVLHDACYGDSGLQDDGALLRGLCPPRGRLPTDVASLFRLSSGGRCCVRIHAC